MSDSSQGPGWWQASDGKWYPPEQAPGTDPAGTSPGAETAEASPASGAVGPAPEPLGEGWWQASDGQWYAPEQAPGGTPAAAGWSSGAPSPGYAAAPAYAAGGAGPGYWQAPTGDAIPLASWGRRVGATLIDAGLSLAIVAVLGILTGIGFLIADAIGVILLIILYVVAIGAGIWFWILNGIKGQSPGKALLGMKVVDSRSGQLIGGGMGFVRGLAHIVDQLACYIGYLWPLWDDQRQTFSDKIVSTVVLDQQPKQAFGPDIFKP